MRRPEDNQPDPPGGRAAERLREFLREHQGEGDDKEQELEQSIDSAENTSPSGPVQPGYKKK